MKSDYHSNYDRISKTMLTHFSKSVNDYWRYYVAEQEKPPGPKRQMVIGSAVHKIVLEKTKPLEAMAIYPNNCFKSNGAINPKPARQFEEDNQDKFVVRDRDAELIMSICNAIYKHELGSLVCHPDAVFEKPQFWTCPHSKLDCRLMCDFYLDVGDEIIAYDLKTTEDIYPVGIKRTSKTFKYWLQDAHYSAGLQEIFGKPVRFKFWFVEVAWPFRIAPYEYPPQSRETAVTAYRSLMKRLAECYANDSWKDDWTTKTNFLELSPWDVDSVSPEVELEGFDDDE